MTPSHSPGVRILGQEFKGPFRRLGGFRRLATVTRRMIGSVRPPNHNHANHSGL